MVRFLKILLLAILIVVAIPVALFIYSPPVLWQTIAGDPDLGPVSFPRLVKAPEPNQYLICPSAVCVLEASDQEAKNYPVDAVTLKLRFIVAIGTDNIEIVEKGDHILRFIVRSDFLKLPTTVNLAFFPTDNGSTFALYARSQIGHSDFGLNEKRVKKWLVELDKLSF